jgi:hypothetical protein
MPGSGLHDLQWYQWLFCVVGAVSLAYFGFLFSHEKKSGRLPGLIGWSMSFVAFISFIMGVIGYFKWLHLKH